MEDDRILIGTGGGSRKVRNTRRDLRVALSVLDFHNLTKRCRSAVTLRRKRSTSLLGSAKRLLIKNSDAEYFALIRRPRVCVYFFYVKFNQKGWKLPTMCRTLQCTKYAAGLLL